MDKSEINKLYELARMNGADKEKEKLSSKAAKILKYIDSLKKADVGSIGATKHAHSLVNIVRPDVNTNFKFSRKILLSGFSGEKNGYLKVKSVFKNNG